MKNYYRRRNGRHHVPSRRVRLELIIGILQCVASMEHTKEKEYRFSSPLNRICTSLRTNHSQVRIYLGVLQEGQLIRRKIMKFTRLHQSFSKPKKQVEIYSVTKKGSRFLELHKKLIDMTPPEMVVVPLELSPLHQRQQS
jgi:predicted transcriptional regulator